MLVFWDISIIMLFTFFKVLFVHCQSGVPVIVKSTVWSAPRQLHINKIPQNTVGKWLPTFDPQSETTINSCLWLGTIPGQHRNKSSFERGRCQELLGFSCSVSRVCQEWSTTQRTSSQLDTTVGKIEVNMHPCGTLLTPWRVHTWRIKAVLRAKGGVTQY